MALSLTVLLTVRRLLDADNVSGEVATITPAWVIGGSFLNNGATGMLPRLPGVVPMEAKLGQSASHSRWLLLLKLNPNPFANNFGQFKETR